jgi:hypothetical protein
VTPLFTEFSRYVASAMTRQLALADLIEDREWAVDINAGTVTFGGDLRYPIQLLGTEAEGDQSWLWAWANTQSNIPPQLLKAGSWLRAYGQQHGIAELTEANLPLDHADGHLLSMVSGGLTRQCYYRGPYQGGALFFLVEQVPDALATVAPQRVLTVLTQVLQMSYPVNHRLMVESFFAELNYQVSTHAASITGHHPAGSLTVSFDGSGRVENIQGQMHAAQQ